MKTEDLILLVKAGYTKEEINALTSSPVPPQPAPAESPKPEPAETEKTEAAAKPDDTPVMKEILDLKKQIMNLSRSQNAADIPNEADKLETALKKLIGG